MARVLVYRKNNVKKNAVIDTSDNGFSIFNHVDQEIDFKCLISKHQNILLKVISKETKMLHDILCMDRKTIIVTVAGRNTRFLRGFYRF